MKKGFTLIELLAVIVILGIIALVTVPIALNTIQQGKQDMFDEQIELIEAGARTFSTEAIYKKNGVYYNSLYQLAKGTSTEPVVISLKILQENGNLSYDISNPLCKGKAKYFSPENTMIRYTYNGKDFVIDIYDVDMGLQKGKEGLEESCTLPISGD